MAFGNLTVDFRQLSKIPVRDRAAIARSPQASEIFGNLPPNEIAALFPNYYKKFIPQGTGAGVMKAGLTGAGAPGGGTGSGTAAPGPTTPVRPGYIEEILSTSSSAKYGEGSNNGQIEVLKFARRWGISPQAAAGVLNIESGVKSNIQGGGGGNFYGVFQLEGKQIPDLTEKAGFGRLDGQQFKNLSVGDQLKVMDEYYKNWGIEPGFFTGDPKTDAAKMWALQLAPGNAKKIDYNDPNAIISQSDQASLIEAKDGLVTVGSASSGSIPGGEKFLEGAELPTALPGTAPITGTAPQGSDAGIIPLTGSEAPSTVIPQTIAFDPKILDQFDPRLKEYYYNTASEAEKRQIGEAVRKLGVPGVQEIMSRHPQMTATAVSDKLYQESTKRFAEASSASNFYDTLRNQYPDKIDVNSEIWNQVDPELAKAKGRIVDADTGLVGRDALLAADSAAKVLRENNYVPRLGSGGDNHSANHGSGRDANYSIDLSASVVNEDGKLVPVQLGKGVPEKVKNDMATAAYFASVGAEGGHRVGYPDSTAPYSMHIQQDPARQSAYWGYSETAKRMGVGTSKLATLQATDEGRRFLAERETINRLSPEQQAEYFDKITGFTEKKLESQSADIVQTTPAQPLPGAAPQTQQQMPVDTNIIPINQTANTAPAMKLGGTQNFEEPNTVKESMSVVSNGKEVAQFNKNEKVNVENGQINVENEFQKKARETRQSNDKNIPVGQYKMKQSTDTDKSYAEQAKYAIIPESPSIARQNRMAQFGGFNHFSRGSKNT